MNTIQSFASSNIYMSRFDCTCVKDIEGSSFTEKGNLLTKAKLRDFGMGAGLQSATNKTWTRETGQDGIFNQRVSGIFNIWWFLMWNIEKYT